MSHRVNPVKDFLSDVTSLAVTYRALLNPAFLRKIRAIHIDPEARNTRLDSRRLESFPATSACANLFGGCKQFPCDAFRCICRYEQIEAAIFDSRHVHDINFTQARISRLLEP